MTLIRNIALIAITTAATAFAQDAQPQQQMDFGPEFRSAYGFSSPFMRDARQYDRLAPLGYPAAETREVLFSRARTLLARYEMQRSQQRIYEQVDRMRRAFHRSSEYIAAQEAEDAAWADYQSAVASVLGRLMEDSSYQANAALAADLSSQIRNVNFEMQDSEPNGRFVDREVMALARTKLRYASEVSAAAAALSADPAVVQARAKVQIEGERTRRMRADFAESIEDDETVLALRERHETARANAVASAAYESLARKLSRGVINYTYNLMYSGRAFYDHWYFENYTWPVVTADAIPAGGQVDPMGQNGYGFRRR